jgi:peptide/nickel transport system permease protein
MGFWGYFVRRVLLLLVVMWGAVTLTFIISRVIPSNPVAVVMGHGGVDPSVGQRLTALWGLNKPLPVQYLDYFDGIFHGNLGISFQDEDPVASDILARLPATIELSIAALVFTLIIAVPVAVVSATRKNSLLDHAGRVFAITGNSAPSFWIAILFLLIFFRDLGWVGVGRLSPQFVPPPTVTGLYTVDSLIAGNLAEFLDALKHLILPGLTLGLGGAAVAMRLLRSSMIEALNSDYIRTARMKGLRERIVIYKHALRNALIPMTTYTAILIGGFLSGAVLTETIFTWNGIGQYTVSAIYASDFPALQGVVLFEAFVFAAANLIVDLAYGVIELAESPRLREWAFTFRMMRRSKLTVVALGVVVATYLIAILAPYLSPYQPNVQHLSLQFQPPTSAHPFGLDELGRDILSRLIWGSRISMIVGIIVVLLSTVIGLPLGAIAGYFGGKIDEVIMRITDIVIAFPGIVLAILFAYILGKGAIAAFIALSLVNWTGIARITRGVVLLEKEKEYTTAARMVGKNSFSVLFGEIIPNSVQPVIVWASLSIGNAIVSLAGLSFIGVGVQPPTADWGSMVAEGYAYLIQDPTLAIIPGLVIIIVSLSFNIIGDGLQDALDPQLRRQSA